MKNFKTFLTEKISKSDTVVVTFGRFNPVSIGHEKLAEKLASVAKQKKAQPILFASTSHDPKKNPISFKDKTALLKKAFPMVDVSTDSSLKNLFQIAGKLSDEGVKNFYLVVGSDRVQEFDKSIRKYIKSGNASLDLQFDNFEVISAGERDPDATGVEGMSASKLRALVADGDMETFIQGLPKRLRKDGEKVYNIVRKGMNIRESLGEGVKLRKPKIAYDIPTWEIIDTGDGEYTGWNVVKDGNGYHLETEYGDRPAKDKKYKTKELALKDSNL